MAGRTRSHPLGPATAAAAAPLGRRERNKLDKWARIERAARAEFARHGFEGAALRAIAARARVATGTL